MSKFKGFFIIIFTLVLSSFLRVVSTWLLIEQSRITLQVVAGAYCPVTRSCEQ